MEFKTILLVIVLSYLCETSTEEPNNLTLSEETPVYDYVDINAKLRKSEIFDQIFNPPYSNSIRPTGVNGSGPVVVAINIRLRSIENLDDVKMEFTIQMNFRQDWIDPRLRFDHIQKNVNYLQLMEPTQAWLPDVFFSNEKTGTKHELMLPNVFARIYPNGMVQTSARITLLLACQMDLRSYPMDKQTCGVEIGPYGWTEEDMILIWRRYTSVEITQGIKMPRFSLISYSNETCPSTRTTSGVFSCLVLKILFERQFGYYLIQIYIPCIMLVAVSWVSFWLEPMAAEARISLCVTTILTVVTQAYGINQNVPPASYIKAIDVWTFMVQFMVFAAIIQFSYVNYVARFEWKRFLKKLEMSNEEIESQREVLKLKGERKAKLVDNISKIVFPVSFGVFNIFYWTFYLTPKESDTSHHKLYVP